MANRKVLIVTYWYPPKRAIGSLRLAKWVKYLPEFGWEPVVVTVEPRTDLYTRHGELSDESQRGRVYRTRDLSLNELFYAWWKQRVKEARKGFEPKRKVQKLPFLTSGGGFFKNLAYTIYKQFVCFPDETVLWLWEYREIERVAREEQPDVLLSSSLPNTSHLIASRLSRRLGIPWVADFRDLWTQNHVLQRVLPLRFFEVWLEKRILQPASALITVSEPLKLQLEEFHHKTVYVIPNGFDPEDFPNEVMPCQNGPLRIVYTGTIYPGKQDPSPLFAALNVLLEQREIHQEDVRVDFYGRRLEVVLGLLERYPEVRAIVRLRGEVSYKEALKAQRAADVLLLLEWTDARAKGVYTGKVFEYLGAGRPILSIGPEGGVIEALLRETGAGIHVKDSQDIIPWLQRWVEEKRVYGTPRYQGNQRIILRYTRREQSRMLAEILAKVV